HINGRAGWWKSPCPDLARGWDGQPPSLLYKPHFTRAHPPAFPISRPCPPWKFPSAAPPRPRLVSSGGGRAPPPAVPPAPRAGPQAQTCYTGVANVWDGCHGTVATLWHPRRRFNAEG